MSIRLSVSISAICSLFASFNTICALIPLWGFLIVRVITSNGPLASLIFCRHLKKARFTFLAIILSTCEIGRHEVKNWGSIDPSLLMHCRSFSQNIFPAKNSLLNSRVSRLVHNLLPVKTLVRHTSQTIRGIEKTIWLEVHLMYIYILRKSQFRYFDSFQRER